MRIDAIAVRIPSLEITNDHVLDFIARFNPELPKAVVKQYQRVIAYLLDKAGARTRYVRDRAHHETAVALVTSAMETALLQADLPKEHIDLLIYCGVGKGFLEPANAYFFADALGMNCQCFDVADACMSWTRSLELANLFLKQDSRKRIMIVNAEFSFYEHGYPDLYKIDSVRQLEYTFPAGTIGEAATATIVSASEQTWTFHYDSAPSFVGLCAIPLKGYEDFTEKPEKHGLNGVNMLFSHGRKMFNTAKARMVPLIQQAVADRDEPDLWFPHAASSRIALEIGAMLKIDPAKLYVDLFPRYGNVVSASIPAAMDMAVQEGRLRRGDKVVLCPASAGMSFAVVQFEF